MTMRFHWQDYKVSIPEGESGDWKVSKFEVSEEDSKRTTLSAMKYGRGFVDAGIYTKLTRNGYTIMSDTKDEIHDHMDPILCAKGHCLVNGLGLGMVARGMLLNDAVKITVIEQSPDVIALVADHLKQEFKNRIEIIEGDAFDFKPPAGVKYGYVWHDIWDNLCEDNLPEMSRLHRKYGRRCENQASWGRSFIESQRRWYRY